MTDRTTTAPDHPWALHAVRASWALHSARAGLAAAVDREAADRRREAVTVAAASYLQAWRPMVGRGGSGGHGDPSSRSVVDALEPVVLPGRLARYADRVTATLAWLVDRIRPNLPDPPASAGSDPLEWLNAVIPLVGRTPTLTRWLDDLDGRIREAVPVPSEQRPLPGVGCPRCGRRRLTLHTAGPRYAWTVTCVPECVCVGPDCACAMAVRLAGVAHIWPADGWLR